MRLLVDTQSFLWYATGDERLPEPTKAELRSAENEVWLSAASAWEIATKHQARRLPLPMPPQDFIAEARERLEIDALPIDEAAVAHLPKLPLLHKDPFDRILMCQSIEHALVLVTNDTMIRKYPVRTLWVES